MRSPTLHAPALCLQCSVVSVAFAFVIGIMAEWDLQAPARGSDADRWNV